MKAITENTLIPISLLISIIVVVFWVSVSYEKVNALENKSEKHENKIESMIGLLTDIRDRIIRLEEQNKKHRD